MTSCQSLLSLLLFIIILSLRLDVKHYTNEDAVEGVILGYKHEDADVIQVKKLMMRDKREVSIQIQERTSPSSSHAFFRSLLYF